MPSAEAEPGPGRAASASALVELLRPGNAAMAAGGVVVGALAAAPYEVVSWFPVALAAGAAACGTAAGNAYNDFRDRDLDARAHPARPIPSGRLSSGAAFEAALVLVGVALVLAWLAHPLVFALAAANVGLLALYEHRAKASGFAGNVLVAWLVASLFLLGAVAATRPAAARDLPVLAAPLLLATLAFAANLARELLKDVQDLAADRGLRSTVPMTIGAERTRRLALVVTVAGVAASPLPFLLDLGFSWLFLALVGVADAALVWAATRPDVERASRGLKIGMLLALAAFAAGRL